MFAQNVNKDSDRRQGYLASKLKVMCIRHHFFKFTIYKSYTEYMHKFHNEVSPATNENEIQKPEFKGKKI